VVLDVLAFAHFSSLSITSVIWLPGLIMAPFSIISRIFLILMGLVLIISGTIVLLEIRLAPLIGEESDEFTLLDKSFNQNPQGNARLGPVAGGIMDCVVLFRKLRI
jgi:hypothetical protein